MSTRVLIVDRDARYREWLRHHLGVLCPEGNVSAMDAERFERDRDSITRESWDLVLFASRFGSSPEDPRSEGLEWLRQLREQAGFPDIIALAEDGNELTAVRALQLGAIDYLPKRLLTAERLRTSVMLALRRIELRSAEATDAELPSLARSLRDPIPGYLIRKTIGESEKAVVYLAGSDSLGIDVALKVSKTEHDEANQRQFLAREHAALSAINHPSIVKIHASTSRWNTFRAAT
jgi:DNA-binding response OmpR family regulator